MSWEEFLALVAAELDCDTTGWTPSATLTEVGLDSLATFELVLALEARGGFRFPDDLIDALRTLGDAWAWADARALPAATA